MENNKHGRSWDCPNGNNKCIYRNCLPAGFALEKDQKSLEKKDHISLEQSTEKGRAALSNTGAKIRLHTSLKGEIEDIHTGLSREVKLSSFEATDNTGSGSTRVSIGERVAKKTEEERKRSKAMRSLLHVHAFGSHPLHRNWLYLLKPNGPSRLLFPSQSSELPLTINDHGWPWAIGGSVTDLGNKRPLSLSIPLS